MDNKLCKDFLNELSSSSPTPGGGGASAYVGAMGVALGSMVGNLTLGKKKYADVQAEIKRMLENLDQLNSELFSLIEEDAKNFEPLSKAYGIPSSTQKEKQEKEEILEDALSLACEVPLKIMRKVIDALEILTEMKAKGTKIAISDVAVGAQFLRAALLGASMNIYINAKLMKNRAKADVLIKETNCLSVKGTEIADTIFKAIWRDLK